MQIVTYIRNGHDESQVLRMLSLNHELCHDSSMQHLGYVSRSMYFVYQSQDITVSWQGTNVFLMCLRCLNTVISYGYLTVEMH